MTAYTLAVEYLEVPGTPGQTVGRVGLEPTT
jgi:hypothetical protein